MEGDGRKRGVRSFKHLEKRLQQLIRQYAKDEGLGFTRDGKLHRHLEEGVTNEKLEIFVNKVNEKMRKSGKVITIIIGIYDYFRYYDTFRKLSRSHP